MAIQTTHQATVTRHRWTVDEYYRMAEKGILAPDARVQLIDGVIFDMPPIGPEHAASVAEVNRIFLTGLGETIIVRGQSPLRLDTGSEPEPDLAVVRYRPDKYRRAHPAPADVLLVIEVSESTLTFDQQTKGLRYAQAGILDYWIANLTDKQIEVHRDPTPDGYKTVQVLKPGDVIRPLAFPEFEVAVSDILG